MEEPAHLNTVEEIIDKFTIILEERVNLSKSLENPKVDKASFSMDVAWGFFTKSKLPIFVQTGMSVFVTQCSNLNEEKDFSIVRKNNAGFWSNLDGHKFSN